MFHRPRLALASFLALILSLALPACGGGSGDPGPQPRPGCPDSDLSRFHPAGMASLDTWSFAPGSCPTSARVTVSPFARFGQGVWMTAHYPAGTVVKLSLDVSRVPDPQTKVAGVGPIKLQGAWDITGYQLISEDAIGAQDNGRRLSISTAAPKIGYLILGSHFENTGKTDLVVDLSSVKISPAP